MSIIVVCGLPQKWDKKTLVAKLVKTINGKFEALSIICTKKSRKCYLRLSEKLDPHFVVQNINKQMFGNVKIHALIPNSIPELAHNVKPQRIPFRMRRAMHIPEESTPGEVIFIAHTELLNELQSIYTGLYNISHKTDHELLRNIARVLLDRLKEILATSSKIERAFNLTKSYRKKHPHFADFQLILSTLHQIEDAQGKPRTQLNKEELSMTNVQPCVIDNIPYQKVTEICRKYTKSIAKKLTQHAENLNTDFEAEPDSEEAAVKRVRNELKRMSAYLPKILRKVVLTNLVPQKSMFYKIRVYGDPYLPTKEVMGDFLKKCRPIKVFRSDRMFNMMRCKVPLENLPSLVDLDGSIVGGATMHIRMSDLQFYHVPDSMKREMLSYCSEDEDIVQEAIDDIDMEDTKEWEENW